MSIDSFYVNRDKARLDHTSSQNSYRIDATFVNYSLLNVKKEFNN